MFGFKYLLIVPAAPHYPGSDGVERLWLGRASAAVRVARQKNLPILFVGDANGGKDLCAYVDFATSVGHDAALVFTARNDPKNKNTRGDMRAAARFLADTPGFDSVRSVTVVTCWYHAPRCMIALGQELDAAVPDRRIRIFVRPVFGQRPPNGLVNELRGCRDYLLRKPNMTRGGHVGKPDLNVG